MARPISFDKQQALQAAMLLFWRQGYGATSLAQLLQHMGISRSSFYASYGDKRSLFIAAVTLFAQRTEAILLQARREAPPLQAIALFFERSLFEVPAHRRNRGCMMVNTVLELADTEPQLCQLASRELDRIEAAFAACFSDAIAAGYLPPQHQPQQLASFMMTVNQGLRVASRQQASPEQLRAILATTNTLLQAAA